MSVRSHLFVCSVAAAIDPVFKSRRSLPRNTILATGMCRGGLLECLFGASSLGPFALLIATMRDVISSRVLT